MNRRDLFKRVAAVAAVVVVAPNVETVQAAPHTVVSPPGPMRPFIDMTGVSNVMITGLTVRSTLGGAVSGQMGTAPSYTMKIENTGTDGRYMRILNPDETVKADYPTRTFEAMQAGCAARGCSLDWQGTSDGPSMPTHVIRQVGGRKIVNGYAGPMFDVQIDAWRRSLHETQG